VRYTHIDLVILFVIGQQAYRNVWMKSIMKRKEHGMLIRDKPKIQPALYPTTSGARRFIEK